MRWRAQYGSGKKMNPQALIEQANKIVLKISSALLVEDGTASVREAWMESLAADIAGLAAQGKQVAIVSSGAGALGRKALDITAGMASAAIPLELKQAAAAVGQVEMSRAYRACFATQDLLTALILLTPRDTEDRRSHLNARATINTLLERRIIPVINENDTVSTAQIRFGDNDRLAARVAQMIGADLLIQLSTIDGLYTGDPSRDPEAQHIPVVKNLSDEHFEMAAGAPAGVTTGGMKTKLDAARIATGAGIPMIIAGGKPPHPLTALIQENAKATLFTASGQPGSARKRWILAHIDPQGEIVIDAGAAKALKSGKSLLPAGVTSVTGEFERGDAVSVLDSSGICLAVGLCAYGNTEAARIAGRNSAEIPGLLGYAGRSELIHRDDLVLVG